MAMTIWSDEGNWAKSIWAAQLGSVDVGSPIRQCLVWGAQLGNV